MLNVSSTQDEFKKKGLEKGRNKNQKLVTARNFIFKFGTVGSTNFQQDKKPIGRVVFKIVAVMDVKCGL
jgi:hypothetical protein